MRKRSKTAGFSLFEVTFAALIIGIMAMLARVAIIRVNMRARASTFWNDGRVFSEAFNRYAQEKGSFPADQTVAVSMPPGMDGYLKQTNWLRTTPLGGRYEWDNKDAKNSLGVVFNGAIKVTGCTWKLEDLRTLDKWFDDNSITTGTFRVTDVGATAFFVVEAGR